MHNIRKISVSGALIIISFFVQAQSINTYSPYSRFGIGQIPSKGFAATKAMGGLSQGIRNPFGINYLNPASYTSQDTMSFILDFGLETNTTALKSEGQSNSSSAGGLHHVAISFPVTKWWGAGFGIVPFSNVGYKIRHYETNPVILSSIGRIRYYNSGSGGLSQVFFGNAVEPFKNLSLGFNLSYIFGSIDYKNELIFPPSAPSGYYNLSETKNIIVSDVAFSFGMQYTAIFSKENNTSLTLGATLDNETKINAKRKTLSLIDYSSFTDTVSYSEFNEGTLDFPKNLSFGGIFNYRNKILAGFDYSQQDWSKAKFFNASDSLVKSETYKFGLEYTPNPKELRYYYKRIHYRVGGHINNSYLQIGNKQINDIGLSVGAGFPFRNNTHFNFSFELGRRGTTSNGLIRETYGIFNLSITFYDFWFIKQKFE